MVLDESYTLADGTPVPRLGLGTWMIDDDRAAQAVRDAVGLGYRMVDTAQAYGNEAGVGEGVRTCGVPREELFVGSKIAAEIKDHDRAAASIDATLAAMGLDYLDQMIIHSPEPWDSFHNGAEHYLEGNLEVWAALEEAQKAGKVREIGVSNFMVADLDNILDHATVRPAVNQVLCHVGSVPSDVMAHCAENSILVEAYSPVAHGALLGSPELAVMAARYGVSVPQLCIRYVLQLGCVALPKTADPAHMASNAAVDFTISDTDMTALDAMGDVDYGADARFPVFSGR